MKHIFSLLVLVFVSTGVWADQPSTIKAQTCDQAINLIIAAALSIHYNAAGVETVDPYVTQAKRLCGTTKL